MLIVQIEDLLLQAALHRHLRRIARRARGLQTGHRIAGDMNLLAAAQRLVAEVLRDGGAESDGAQLQQHGRNDDVDTVGVPHVVFMFVFYLCCCW